MKAKKRLKDKERDFSLSPFPSNALSLFLYKIGVLAELYAKK
ncbi:hypothetical protein [Salinibacillus aidingensis]